MRTFLLSGILFTRLIAFGQKEIHNEYKQDFNFFWKAVKENYAYWDKKQTDWQRVYTIYNPLFDTVTSKHSFILLLEKVINEVYDHHFTLTANTMSQKLVPSGADMWAEYIKGKPIITQVKAGSGSANAGIKEGMELVAFNDTPIQRAILAFMPKALKRDDFEAYNYSLRVLLAGNHKGKRKITVLDHGHKKDFFPDSLVNTFESTNTKGLLESKIMSNNVGYIKIFNTLGNNELIHAFDSTLNRLLKTSLLILDLRETPGGGNTTVARSIMGHFITKEGFYQKHELPSEQNEYGVKRSWIEIVSPRLPYYSKPVIILVDHWTGSVGEGITIGFDALKRATIIGTPMAGLNGAIYSFTMSNTQIGFSLPSEKLFHVNGTPRESFKPGIIVDLLKPHTSNDYILKVTLAYIKSHLHK